MAKLINKEMMSKYKKKAKERTPTSRVDSLDDDIISEKENDN